MSFSEASASRCRSDGPGESKLLLGGLPPQRISSSKDGRRPPFIGERAPGLLTLLATSALCSSSIIGGELGGEDRVGVRRENILNRARVGDGDSGVAPLKRPIVRAHEPHSHRPADCAVQTLFATN